MNTPDSRGERASFPQTAWSAIQEASDPEARRRQLQRLYEMYAQPVYRWLRLVFERRREDAEDIRQSFFLHLLETDVIASYRREGKFRAFLKGALRHFVMDFDKAERRLKRGGGAGVESIEGWEESLVSADRAFDDEWATVAIDRALNELHQTLLSERDERKAAVVKLYLLPLLHDRERPSQKRVADQLGVSEQDVENDAKAARNRMRVFLRRTIRDTVQSDADVPDELRWILKGE